MFVCENKVRMGTEFFCSHPFLVAKNNIIFFWSDYG